MSEELDTKGGGGRGVQTTLTVSLDSQKFLFSNRDTVKSDSFLVPNQCFFSNEKTNLSIRPRCLIKLHIKKIFDKPMKNAYKFCV